MNERQFPGIETPWRAAPRRPTDGSRLRCGDAVSTGSRALLSSELVELGVRSTRALLTGGALFILGTLLFFGFLAALAAVTTSDGSLQPTGIAVMVLLLTTVPALLLCGAQRLRRGFHYRSDARHGVVYRFERSGTAVPAEADWFEVLPSSKVVWSSSPSVESSMAETSFREIADPSPFAATAAEWTSPVEGGPKIGLHVNLRELTAAERLEVRRHALSTALLPLRLAVPLTLWTTGVLYLLAQNRQLPAGYHWGSFLLLCLATACADAISVGGLIQAWWLWRDQQVARVIIVRLPSEVDPSTPEVARLSPPREFLPFSRRRWTLSGDPAPWRVK